VGVLDALGVEQAAVVGLSFGGGLALDVALEHPERVWALAHVAGGVSGLPVGAYTAEQEAGYEAAIDSGDLDAAMTIDFAVWAPLGSDDKLRELLERDTRRAGCRRRRDADCAPGYARAARGDRRADARRGGGARSAGG